MAGAFGSGLTEELRRRIGASASDIGPVGDTGPTVPDLGFGPVSEASLAGEAPPAPSLWDKFKDLGSTAERYAELPARATVDQFNTATDQVAKAIGDPSLPNLTGAAFNTALAAGRPLAAGVALAGGAGLMGAKDLLGSEPATAGDQALPGVDPAMMDQYAKNQKLIRRIGDKDNPRVQEAQRFNSNVEGISADYIKAQNANRAKNENAGAEAAATKAANDETLRAQKEAQKQAEYDAKVKGATANRDKNLARVKRFTEWDSPWKQLYDNIGGEGAAPFSTGLAEGSLARAALGGGKGFWGKLGKDWVIPAIAGGVSGFATSNIPDAYNYQANDPDNPIKEAWEGYAHELPDGHPDKAAAAAFAAPMKDANPIRDAAMQDLYSNAGNRLVMYGGEGAAGAKFGNFAAGAAARGAKGAYDWAKGRGSFAPGTGLDDIVPPASSIVARAPSPPRPSGPGTKTPAGNSTYDMLDAKGVIKTLKRNEVSEVVDSVMKAVPKGTIGRKGVRDLMKEHKLQDASDIVKKILESQLAAKKAPNSYSSAVDWLIGKK